MRPTNAILTLDSGETMILSVENMTISNNILENHFMGHSMSLPGNKMNVRVDGQVLQTYASGEYQGIDFHKKTVKAEFGIQIDASECFLPE
jgi:hypothetical protein